MPLICFYTDHQTTLYIIRNSQTLVILEIFNKNCWMDIEAFQNCTENGEIFSCFFKIGATQNMTECEDRCRSKNLFAFDLNDFYNFADRLNQSNFLVERKSPQFNSSSVESLLAVSRKSKKLADGKLP